jgi:two-component system chemotaxis response regulator CheY
MKTILFVDDHASIRELVNDILLSNGYNVLLSDDGKNAINYFDGRNIDLLITDLHMEQMDGIELTKNVRSNSFYKHLPIIVLTTESQIEMKTAAKNAGATGWIVKPFDSANLLKVVNKLIR